MSHTPQQQTLAEQLEHRKAIGASKAPPQVTLLRQAETQKLIESGIAEQSLKQGDVAPDFSLLDVDGKTIHLADLLEEGPVVITFYRGSWCPYCNLHLRYYQTHLLPELHQLGAKLVAISPQTQKASQQIISKGELDFPVLSDRGNQVAHAFRLVFTLPESLRPYTANLPEYNADETWQLPLPGSFVVDQSGIIQHAFVHADYTKRLEPAIIIDTLRRMV